MPSLFSPLFCLQLAELFAELFFLLRINLFLNIDQRKAFIKQSLCMTLSYIPVNYLIWGLKEYIYTPRENTHKKSNRFSPVFARNTLFFTIFLMIINKLS